MPIYQNGQRVGALFNSGTEQTTAYMNGQLVYSKDDGLPVRPAGTTTNLSVGYNYPPDLGQPTRIVSSQAVLWSASAGFTLVSSTLDRSGYTSITSENDFALSVYRNGAAPDNKTYVYPWSDAGYGAVRPETFEYQIVCKSPLDNTFVYLSEQGLYGTVKWSLADGFHGVTAPQVLEGLGERSLFISPTANTLVRDGLYLDLDGTSWPLVVYAFDSETGVGGPIPLPPPPDTPATHTLALSLAYHPSGRVAFILWVDPLDVDNDGIIFAYQLDEDGGFGTLLDSYLYLGAIKLFAARGMFVSPTGGAVIINGQAGPDSFEVTAVRWDGDSFGATYPPPPVGPPAGALIGVLGFDAQGSALFYAPHLDGVNSKVLGAIRWSDASGFGALHTPLNLAGPETVINFGIWPAINYIENTND